MEDSSSEVENECTSQLRGATKSGAAKRSRPSNNGQRKKMFRWTACKDMLLVKEASVSKPFLESGRAATELWASVADAVNQVYPGANVKELSVKRRFYILLGQFKAEDFRNRFKSGTEEEVTVMIDQMAEIVSLIDDAKLAAEAEATQKSKKTDDEKAMAEEIRGAAVSTVKRKSVDGEPAQATKRTSEKSLTEMWNDKQEHDRLQQEKKMEADDKRHQQELEQRDKDRELRLRELELREKALDLERMKQEQSFKLQQTELTLKQQQFEVEKKERSCLAETQKTMMEFLMHKLQ